MYQSKNNRYKDDYALESVEFAGAYEEPEVSIIVFSTSYNNTIIPDPRAPSVLHDRK